MVRMAVANDVAGDGAGRVGAAGAIPVAEPAFARVAARALVPAAGAIGDADGPKQHAQHFQHGEVVTGAGNARDDLDAYACALRDADCDLLGATTGKAGSTSTRAADAERSGSAGNSRRTFACDTARHSNVATGRSFRLVAARSVGLAGRRTAAGGALCLGEPQVWAAAGGLLASAR